MFFENAGGSLTLKQAVERTAELQTIPDNLGRSNAASIALGQTVAQGRDDMRLLFGASSGEVFIGETGTELLGRLIRNAALSIRPGGTGHVLGSNLEHPATYSACRRWAEVAGMRYEQVAFDTSTSVVGPEHYSKAITPETVLATIIHASPVTGMHVDVEAIVDTIRSVAPDCFIIVDGIQHAAHGLVEVDRYDVDGYVVSGYKLFSRHNFGVAWISDRLAIIPHDQLDGAPPTVWEMGTRDVSAYAAFSEVVRYLEWLGSQVSPNASDGRDQLQAATTAIGDHERYLANLMLSGTDTQPGLTQMDSVSVIGPTNVARSGMVSFSMAHLDGPTVVDRLNEAGIRTHARKRDYYSATVLEPLDIESCVRVSAGHYNSAAEVDAFLSIVAKLDQSSSRSGPDE